MEHTQTNDKIEANIDTATMTGCFFIIQIEDMYGVHTDFGHRMTEPLLGDILYDRWENGVWRTTSVLPRHLILNVWTEFDECDCGVFIVNLDNWMNDRPVCDLCLREGELSRAGDLMAADGGLI